MDLQKKEQAEIDFWKTAEHENPHSDSILNLAVKTSAAKVLWECVQKFPSAFSSASRILELGGGQGWAACTIKKLYPEASVVATDISEHAIASLPKWERIFNVKIDHSYHCQSYATQENANSVDIVFCYSAAHHFVKHKKTFLEISRILKPGGKCFYFFEVACSKLMYPMAYKRVNRMRPDDVIEDVLIYTELLSLARRLGFEATAHFYPTTETRAPLAMMYYYLLGKVAFLQKILPCTINFEFTKIRANS